MDDLVQCLLNTQPKPVIECLYVNNLHYLVNRLDIRDIHDICDIRDICVNRRGELGLVEQKISFQMI